MKCLLVIDVQNGFVSSRTAAVVPQIEQLMEKFKDELIISTQFVNLDDSGFTRIMHWKRLKQSPEIDLIEGVAKRSTYTIVKTTYTACNTEIMKLLHDNQIEEAYIAGIDTDCCVLKTAIDLFELGIRPIVLTKYCASNGGESSHLAAIKVLERTIGRDQIKSDEYV